MWVRVWVWCRVGVCSRWGLWRDVSGYELGKQDKTRSKGGGRMEE